FSTQTMLPKSRVRATARNGYRTDKPGQSKERKRAGDKYPSRSGESEIDSLQMRVRAQIPTRPGTGRNQKQASATRSGPMNTARPVKSNNITIRRAPPSGPKEWLHRPGWSGIPE